MPEPRQAPPPPRILILGGTGEASALAGMLAAREKNVDAVLSLAGRTAAPAGSPLPTRVGGFGGADGLARHLAEEGFGLVVDATHPFAATISANAARACAGAGVALLAIRRPAWTRGSGDLWTEVDDLDAAARALGSAPRRVLLTVGRQGLAAFRAAPQHAYLARTIEPAEARLPGARTLTARGPFTEADEVALMRAEGIEVVVTKNAGGAATSAKLAAARALGLPVVMVRRPEKPAVPEVADAAAALARIEAFLRGPHAGEVPEAGTKRGV
jgi:precorrin-6A/cobalt-precorrin-6A reductase